MLKIGSETSSTNIMKTLLTSKCIYCLRILPIDLFNKEHVMPQAFGTFDDNLTLINCVCGDCNRFFGNNLEPLLSEGSFEAVRRLEYGVKSANSAKYLRRDRVHLSFRGGEWDGLILGLHGNNDGLFIMPASQVKFARKNRSGWVHFTESELLHLSLPLPQEIDTKRIILFYDSEETKERLIQMLSKLGIPYQENENGFLSQERIKGSRIGVETRIDTIIIRCLAKIAFNYLAKTAGNNLS